MKRRIILLAICAVFLLTGGLLLKAFKDEQKIPSFYWWSANENTSVSLFTMQDGHDACLQWTDIPLDQNSVGCNLGLYGKWQLKDSQLTLKLEDGTVLTGVLEDDAIHMDYAGGILLESYERLKEKVK